MKCGLLGQTLGHSYSPQIHGLLADYEYRLYEKEPSELEAFLRNGDFSGLNVTMPYKQAVIPYLDELTPIAAQLGAVNTIVRRDGKLVGHNTDYAGFLAMVKKSGLSPTSKKCVILGSGGASRVAQAVLKMLGAEVIVISRSGDHNYGNIRCHEDAAIVVNTTPVGMYPNTGISPVELSVFTHLEGVLDLIYNPARTKLLMDAEKQGIITINGLWMLVAQAKEAAEWFTGTTISDNRIAEIHRILKSRMENVILIGMPGCGKTTVGRMLATHTGRAFADMDKEVEKLAKKSIPTIFAQEGESRFRDWETETLELCGKNSGLVIATGGGCVTMERNYPILHQNGTIFWLQRSVDSLPIDGRPLSIKHDLHQMYAARKPLYAQFADHIIDSNGTPAESAAAILEVLL